MKRVYRKSKKLLQTSSLLALALSFPLKAAPSESLEDRAARAVAVKFAADHPIEKDGPSEYFKLAAMIPEPSTRAIVHYLPDNTRGKLLDFIGKTDLNEELSLQQTRLASSIFEEIRKDQNSYLQLSFINNQIMGHHSLLGPEEINLNRFFKNGGFNNFNALTVKLNVDNAIENRDALSRLSESGISRLKLNWDPKNSAEEKVKRLTSFFQSGWNQLVELDFGDQSIGAHGATAIANSQTLTNLQSLNLRNNYIGDAGATAIANSQTLTNLQSLNLINNYIGDNGAIAIANSQTLTNLQNLDLSGNLIGAAGATAIANSQTLTNLQSLNLSSHPFSGAEKAIRNIRNNPIFKNTKIKIKF